MYQEDFHLSHFYQFSPKFQLQQAENGQSTISSNPQS